MKNITVSFSNGLVRRVGLEAARQNKSVARFVADLLAARCKAATSENLAVLREFFDGLGYAGLSQAWRGRVALYAEREDELIRRSGRPVHR
jgi:hypothetical protein